MITMISGYSARIAFSRSSPDMPGIFRSVIARSGGEFRICSKAEAASAAAATSYPLCSSCARVTHRKLSSSSTTRMRFLLNVPPLVQRNRQGKRHSAFRVSLGRHHAAMLAHDLIYHREPQTRACVLRRVERVENLVQVFSVDAGPLIPHADRHR